MARAIAAAVRRPGLRTLGLQVGDRVQVSMNLVDPDRLGPATAYDLVAEAALAAGRAVAGAELVGLVPARVLDAVPRGALGRARPGRGPHDRSPPRRAPLMSPPAVVRAQAVAPARRAMAR